MTRFPLAFAFTLPLLANSAAFFLLVLPLLAGSIAFFLLMLPLIADSTAFCLQKALIADSIVCWLQ